MLPDEYKRNISNGLGLLEKELEKGKTIGNGLIGRSWKENAPVVLWKRACALCSKGLRIEYLGNEIPYPSFRTCCGVYVCHACATDASSGCCVSSSSLR